MNFPDTANDDHPPTDVTHGQDLVFQIFWALFNSPAWSRTMLVVTYDEHGGFHDHVPPPRNPTPEGPAFTWLGARVPTLVVSPHVGRGLVSKRPFDHTSIIKTILTRFDIPVPGDLPRVGAADHLGWLLDAPTPRFPTDDASVRALSRRAALATVGERLRWRAATAPPTAARPPTELEEQIRAARTRFADAVRKRRPVPPPRVPTPRVPGPRSAGRPAARQP